MNAILETILSGLPSPSEVLFVLSVWFGAVIHFYHSKFYGTTQAKTLTEYWVVDAPGASVATGMVLFTGAGTILAGHLLQGMNLWMVVLTGGQLGYGVDSLVNQSGLAKPTTVVNTLVTAAVPPAAPAAQKGFARLGLLALLVALSASFTGCALLGGSNRPAVLDVPAEKGLPEIGQKAQLAVNAANSALATVYTVVRDGLRDQTLAPPDARKLFDKADEYRKVVDDAQGLIDAGGFDAAKAKAEATSELIKILHDQAIAAAKKRSTGYYDLQPTLRRMMLLIGV